MGVDRVGVDGVGGQRPLAGLLPAVAALLGHPVAVPGEHDWLRTLDVRHVVVLLVDGLGDRQLNDHLTLMPALGALSDLGPLRAPFPATTCVSLTSLGTGLPPGMHGIVGTSFRLEDGATLAPLSWRDDPNPIATQPEPTVLEHLAAAGVAVASCAPSAYRNSGLTRAALRGGTYHGTDSSNARVSRTRAAIEAARAAGRPSMTYVYWPDLDKAGHVHGVAAAPYRDALGVVDRLVAGLAALAAPDVALLVTADHGMVDVPDDRRVDLEARPTLRRGVQTILGEPRVRHVYTEAGRAQEVAATWSAELAGIAQVLVRDQVADLLGPVDDWHADRIGDVVAIAEADWALVSGRVDRLVSSLRGQHGGLTGAEVLVPLRVATG